MSDTSLSHATVVATALLVCPLAAAGCGSDSLWSPASQLRARWLDTDFGSGKPDACPTLSATP